MREAYPNELYHHGILGQKWGKKNGPPYPLDYSDHSAAEKKKLKQYKFVEKSDSARQKKVQRIYDPSVKRAQKRYEETGRKLMNDPNNEKLQKKHDKATENYLYSRETRDQAKAFIDNIRDMEMDKIERGEYSISQTRGKRFVEWCNQATLGWANFLGKDVHDIAIQDRLPGLSKDEIKEAKNKAFTSARDIRKDYEADVRNWVGGTKGTEAYNSGLESSIPNKPKMRDRKYLQEDFKKQLINNAKTKDEYQIDFLEAIQNTTLLTNNKNKRLELYDEYLSNYSKDPANESGWIEEFYRKLKPYEE